MLMTSVSITMGLTHNLGDYSNVRPEVQMSAQVLPGDDADDVIDELRSRAISHLYYAADTIIESYGKPAFFSDLPRFALAANTKEQIGFILSVNQVEAFRKARDGYRIHFENHRYTSLHRLIDREFPDYTIIEAQHDDDFETIPTVDRLGMYEAETCRIVVFVDQEKKLPQDIQKACVYTHVSYCLLTRYLDRLPKDRPILIFDGSEESLEDIRKYFPPPAAPVGGDPDQFDFDDDDDDDDED